MPGRDEAEQPNQGNIDERINERAGVGRGAGGGRIRINRVRNMPAPINVAGGGEGADPFAPRPRPQQEREARALLQEAQMRQLMDMARQGFGAGAVAPPPQMPPPNEVRVRVNPWAREVELGRQPEAPQPEGQPAGIMPAPDFLDDALNRAEDRIVRLRREEPPPEDEAEEIDPPARLKMRGPQYAPSVTSPGGLVCSCQFCGAAYKVATMKTSTDGLIMCGRCVGQFGECQYCGWHAAIEVLQAKRWAHEYCPDCGPSQKLLNIKQRQTFTPLTDVMKTRREGVWRTISPSSS